MRVTGRVMGRGQQGEGQARCVRKLFCAELDGWMVADGGDFCDGGRREGRSMVYGTVVGIILLFG